MNTLTELSNYFKLLERLKVVKTKREKEEVEFQMNKILK